MTAKEEQLYLNDAINRIGINIVTCGDCGEVLLHKTSEETITCPHCSYTSEPCDFPDLIH
jgi:exosome complex RNA-binding protein Csl4